MTQPPPRTRREGPATIALGDILTGLSHALDITEGQERGHTARACLIGMRLAAIVGLSEIEQRDLFYALLIKDAGGSDNAPYLQHLFARAGAGGRDAGMRDWRSLVRERGYSREYSALGGSIWDRLATLGHLARVGREDRRSLFRIRAKRGATMALGLGLSDAAAAAIRAMDEHWDGGGDPIGLRGDAIPILARIIALAQTAAVFAQAENDTTALVVVQQRSGRWFDPALVAAFRTLHEDRRFWESLQQEHVDHLVKALEPPQMRIVADESRLDQIADAFASLIDAKSPYTSDHSRRVAFLAAGIGERLGFSPYEVTRIRRAALLHDIGKLGVPSHILEKKGPLNDEEWALVREHPRHTLQILEAVPGFRDFAFDAACHHEKLDGSGYHCGYTAEQLSQTARALTVADMADALLTDRPYRQALDPMDALRVLHRDCVAGRLCPDSVEAFTDYVREQMSDAPSTEEDASTDTAAADSETAHRPH